MSQRLEFIHRLEDGESMASVCRDFGISRVTGYKFKRRYQELGEEGLYNESRRPGLHPRKTPDAMVRLVVSTRVRFPRWGPKKLRYVLQDENPGVQIPSASTIGVILKSAGLVGTRKRRRRVPLGQGAHTVAERPNQLWTSDFKGQFRTGSIYCYPLTINDDATRFSLACVGLESTRSKSAIAVFRETFQEYGVPDAIKTDNGVPFASVSNLGLTPLSVYWMSLGIRLFRIEPGKPQQNGAHERFHLTLKEDCCRPAKDNVLAQQEAFDAFRNIYNNKRPHESLGMKKPTQLYKKSERTLQDAQPTFRYSTCDDVRTVYKDGCVRLNGKKVHLAPSLAGYPVGFRQIDEETSLVIFRDYEIGYIDILTNRFLPAITP